MFERSSEQQLFSKLLSAHTLGTLRQKLLSAQIAELPVSAWETA